MRAIVAVVCLTSVSCTSPYPNSIPDIKYIDSLKCETNNNRTQCQKTVKNVYEIAADEVKNNEKLLRDKEQQLATQKYALSDTSAAGAVTSVIAAASGTLTTALYAGGVSVVGGVAGQRYNYDLQLLNYRTTRQKFNCIYRAMMDLPTNQLQIAISTTPSPSVTELIRPSLNSAMSELMFELQSQQAAVSLVAPDITAIAETLKQQRAAQAHIVAVRPENFLQNTPSASALAELIRTNINMCKASPTTAPATAVPAGG
ncbi:hypothetical protein PEC106568_10160 [Pectobacterium carotovorum subsp. carotovorum]|nr:hypothetical protein PEC106568_10160 [Pectobacterium carotovorum subsp. carotovorum]